MSTHTHTETHTLAHAHTTPGGVLLVCKLGYRKTTWSASRHTDGSVVSHLIKFKVKCETQKMHGSSRQTNTNYHTLLLYYFIPLIKAG